MSCLFCRIQDSTLHLVVGSPLSPLIMSISLIFFFHNLDSFKLSWSGFSKMFRSLGLSDVFSWQNWHGFWGRKQRAEVTFSSHRIKCAINVVVVQSLIPIQLLKCNLMKCSTPSFPVLHYLPKFAQTHIHWVSDTIQPSHPLLPLSPFAFSLS